LFAHCERRGCIPQDPNPFADTKRRNGLRENAIEVCTPEEMTKLLAGVAQDLVPCPAIGGFAGLRTSAILALDWQDVRLAEPP
jgi:integrase